MRGGSIITKRAPENEFEVQIHSNLPGERFIDGITLYSFYKGEWVPQTMGVTGDGERKLKAKVEGFKPEEFRELALKRKKDKSAPRLFLSITFLKISKTGYKQYNYDSPWIFPIRVIDRKEEVRKKHGNSRDVREYQRLVDNTSGYRVEAHGEVPDFVWYQQSFNGYSTGVIPDRTPDEAAENTVKIPD